MTDFLMNRIANCRNEFQGKTKRVLCVCSAGLLRSPTVAVVLSAPPWNYNTRAAGMAKQFALIAVDDVLLQWADEVICMEEEQAEELAARLRNISREDTPIFCLGISDSFGYRDEALMKLVTETYTQIQRIAESTK